jgi:hypothetical protein
LPASPIAAAIQHHFGALHIVIVARGARHARITCRLANARAEQANSPHTELNRVDELE